MEKFLGQAWSITAPTGGQESSVDKRTGEGEDAFEGDHVCAA
jgi:hypothetical protein